MYEKNKFFDIRDFLTPSSSNFESGNWYISCFGGIFEGPRPQNGAKNQKIMKIMIFNIFPARKKYYERILIEYRARMLSLDTMKKNRKFF